MSKKQFTANLEDLLDTPVQSESVSTSVGVAAQPMPTRARASKGFLADIDAIFQDAESTFSKIDGAPKTNPVAGSQQTLPLRGLDALIRRTETGMDMSVQVSTTKRVIISLDAAKIENLKRLASSKKMYMRDIINLALARYLEELEAPKP
jgi:hypothetical protein